MSDGAYEPRLVKTDLKIYVDVIPKEGLAAMVPAKPSFGDDRQIAESLF